MEVREERGVRQVLQARGVVSHDVSRAWEVLGAMAVSMGALVSAGVVAEVGCWTVAGDGSLDDARDCGSVVAPVG